MGTGPGIRVGFGLGSNLGDRGRMLEEAILFLGEKGRDLRRSPIFESDPVDCPPGSPKFLNAAAEMEYSGDLMELLQSCQDFERREGRPEIRERNAPRPMDIDILYADGLLSSDPRLVLPHPRLHLRAFVLQPLMEICPDRVIPGLNRRVRDLWQDLMQNGEEQLCRKIV